MASTSSDFFEEEGADPSERMSGRNSAEPRGVQRGRDTGRDSGRDSGRDAGGGREARRTQAQQKKSSKGSAPRNSEATGPATSGRRPPSFALVVVIAVVGVLLGFALGYFVALSQVSRYVGNLQEGLNGETSAQAPVSMPTDVNAEAGLPEGHPDLSSMVNEDGSVNQEALDAFKAQMEAQGQ